MLFRSKKGKGTDASAAAALIAIIAALIILYILFLPPEERQKILDEAEDDYNRFDREPEVLLQESPQTLSPIENLEFEKKFSSINIQVGEEGLKLKEVDSLYVKRSLFTNKPYVINFFVNDLSNTQEALLNFIVEDNSGRLMVTLNGNEILNKELETGNINPINIKDILIAGENKLEFSASSPGAMFWKTNEFNLEDILITSDILRKEAQESVISFVVSSQEKENMQRAKLYLLPECSELEVGPLSIKINNYEIYSAIPDCGVPMRAIEFIPDMLVTGENKLSFSTTNGWYLVDNLKLSSELKEAIATIYYFEIDNNDWNGIQDNDVNVTLFMKFADDSTRKMADLLINNHALRLDQTEVEYNETITEIVEKGNNAIKIEPDEILEIVDLKVKLES